MPQKDGLVDDEIRGSRRGVAVAVGEEESGGDEEDGEEDREEQAADDRLSERRVGLAALAKLHGHGKQADDGGERGHEDGTEADAAGGDDGAMGGHALLEEGVGELDDEDAVGEGDADEHDDAHKGHDVDGGAPKEEGEQDSAECRGKGEEDEEGIGKGAELGYEDEIEQKDGEDEADREAVKGG